MNRDRAGRWAVYIGAILFLESVSYIVAHRHLLLEVSPVLFVGLIFAANRFGRAIAYNGVAEPIRWWFSKVKADSSGAGDGIEPAGAGLRHGIGELLTCPICSGTWSAVLLVNLYLLDPWFGSVVIYGFGAAGGAELLNWMNEHFTWSARYYREEAGSHVYRKCPPDEIPGHQTYQKNYLHNHILKGGEN